MSAPALHRAFLAVHRVVALAVFAFVVVLGVTGSLMAFEGPLDRALAPRCFTVAPSPRPPLPLLRLGAIAAARGRAPALAFRLPRDARDSYSAFLGNGGEVFLDGATGAVLGSRRGSPFLQAVHSLHTQLLLGGPGRTVVSWAGVGAFVVTLTGFVVWLRTRRAWIHPGGGVRGLFDLHAVAGLYAYLFLLLVSGTGVLIAFDDALLPRLYAATGTRPVPRAAHVAFRPGRSWVSPERALAAAAAAVPGGTPFLLGLPDSSGTPYEIRVRAGGDLTPGGRSWVIVDPYDARVLVAQDIRRAPLPARWELAVRQLHTGDAAGTPGRVLASATALLAVLQACSGALLWWRRRRRASAG